MISTAIPQSPKSTTIDAEALNILAYFSVFNYPLSLLELQNFLSEKANPEILKERLNESIQKGILVSDGTFFGIGNREQFNNRITGNSLFTRDWRRAQRYIKIISKAPYVRGLLVTGSMSKGYNYIGGDVDYLVITKPGRLWIARTLLVLYKKLFLFNSKKYFCVNYFISANKLEIEDKNMFTAVELATAVPVYNSQVSESFFNSNKWVNHYLTSDKKLVDYQTLEVGKERGKKAIEFLLNNRFGNGLDTFCRFIHLKYWNWKFRNKPKAEGSINIQNTKDVSKYHPGSFRNKVLKAYQEKRSELQISNP